MTTATETREKYSLENKTPRDLNAGDLRYWLQDPRFEEFVAWCIQQGIVKDKQRHQLKWLRTFVLEKGRTFAAIANEWINLYPYKGACEINGHISVFGKTEVDPEDLTPLPCKHQECHSTVRYLEANERGIDTRNIGKAIGKLLEKFGPAGSPLKPADFR